MVIDLAMQIKDEIKHLITKDAELQERLDELTAERDEWRTKCETREFAYKQADAERKRYSKQIDSLTAERDELQRERNAAIGRASYMERSAAEELAKLLGENDTIELYDDKIHGKRRLVTGTQRKLEKQIAEMQEAIDAMGNGQFYAMYKAKCEECELLKKVVRTQAESFKKLECELAGKDG